MSGFVSRFVVAESHEVTADDLDSSGALRAESIERWIASACNAYVDQCPVLRGVASSAQGAVQVVPTVAIDAASLGRPSTVIVSAGATELRPTSFTIALRVRAIGGEHDALANAACEVAVVGATGDRVELDDTVRDELIALEHAASHLNERRVRQRSPVLRWHRGGAVTPLISRARRLPFGSVDGAGGDDGGTCA